MTPTAVLLPATELQGRITQLAGNLVQGWVHDASDPQRQWAVAIMADDQLLALANADQYNPAAPSNGMHGFQIMLSDTQLQSSSRIPRAGISVLNHGLGGQVQGIQYLAVIGQSQQDAAAAL